MKILQIGSYLPPDLVGGAEYTAKCFADSFERAGHQVVNLRWKMPPSAGFRGSVAPSTVGGWELRAWRPMEPIRSAALTRKALFYAMEWVMPVNGNALNQMIEQEAIDLIVVHSFRGLGYDILKKIAKCNRPIVMVLHDFALICLNKGMARKGSICKTLCSVCRAVARRNSEALNLSPQVALLSPSAFMLDRVRSNLNLSNAISRHIPNPNRYNFLPRVRDKSGALTWGYFGRIEPDKGFVSDLFEAADRIHRHSGARWIVAGKGSMQDALTSFARTRPWVDFRGLLPEDQMAQAFDAIDVLALPSLWPENFPGILVQALGNGVPAVGFDIGGIPEVIDHGKTGIVAPFKDFQALSDAILSLDADRDRLKNMSIAALDAANRYDADKLEGQLLELVTQVVSRQDFSALP